MGILVSFLRGIVSLVLFAAAVTTVVIDMEFIGEKLGKYKLLRYGLIAGVVLLLFLIGFNSTCNVVIIAIDIYGVWAFFQKKKKKMIWHGKSARQTKKKSEGPQSAIRKQRISKRQIWCRRANFTARQWGTQSAEGFASDPYAVCREIEKRGNRQSEIGTAPRSVSIPHRGMQRGYFGNGKGNFLAKMYFQTAGEK